MKKHQICHLDLCLFLSLLVSLFLPTYNWHTIGSRIIISGLYDSKCSNIHPRPGKKKKKQEKVLSIVNNTDSYHNKSHTLSFAIWFVSSGQLLQSPKEAVTDIFIKISDVVFSCAMLPSSRRKLKLILYGCSQQ